MQNKRQLITMGDDGELALKSSDGSLQSLPDFKVPTSQSLVYLVIDCSGSMSGSKMTQARKGALSFARTALDDGYQIGLISFSDNTYHLCSPIDNMKELTIGVDRLKIQGGTSMSPAIEEVISQFKYTPDALRAMVIVTDGATSNPQDALKAADKAKKLGISILTIGTDDADYDFLSQLASDTTLAKKVSNEYLEEAISEIAKLLPQGN
jgi:Mg-chelatase subunit ChlD